MMRAVVAILSVGVVLASALRADERDDYRQMLARNRKQQESYINRLELLPGKRQVEDLLRVVNDGERLTIQSPLFSAEMAEKFKSRQMRAEVEGFEGFCTLIVQPIAQDSYYFTFSNVSYPNLEGASHFSITMQPGHLQISRSFSSRSRNYTINLVQSQGRLGSGQSDGIQLNVYGGDNRGPGAVNLNLFEADFTSLRRKHPREVDEHVRPLMRELKLENLFAVDSMTAWQVFSEEWKGNPNVAGQIQALLPDLDVDDYSQRDKARQAIRKLGPEAALVIYRMDRQGLAPEQNCQLDTVLGAHSFLSRPEARRLMSDVDFLLDCLYSEDGEVRSIAVKRLREVARREVGLDPKADYVTRVARVEALRGELRGTAATQPVGKG